MLNIDPIIELENKDSRTRNPHFFQFYKRNFSLVRFLVENNHSAAKLFFHIVEHMDKSNALVISQVALCESLNMCRTKVWKSAKYLKDNKYLNVYKSGTSNIYVINCQLIWQQAHNRKKFAKFNASVYITESEQLSKGKTEKLSIYKPRDPRYKIDEPNRNFDNERQTD